MRNGRQRRCKWEMEGVGISVVLGLPISRDVACSQQCRSGPFGELQKLQKQYPSPGCNKCNSASARLVYREVNCRICKWAKVDRGRNAPVIIRSLNRPVWGFLLASTTEADMTENTKRLTDAYNASIIASANAVNAMTEKQKLQWAIACNARLMASLMGKDQISDADKLKHAAVMAARIQKFAARGAAGGGKQCRANARSARA